jgi:hypothetical protein
LENLIDAKLLLWGLHPALSATISAYVKVFVATEIEARISALEAREKIAEAAYTKTRCSCSSSCPGLSRPGHDGGGRWVILFETWYLAMTYNYRQRLSRLEAKSDLRHPKEQKVTLLNFMGPDGPVDADFATTLDADPLCFHRRPEETVAMFQERVCDELRVRDEHNARKNPMRVIIFQCNYERAVNQSVS